MSTTGNDRFSKIMFWVGILIIPTILIIQVLVYKPFFTHMDDGKRLAFVDGLNLWGSAQYFAVDLLGDAYGHFGAQAVSTLSTWPLYELGNLMGSAPYFLLNAVFVALITYAAVSAMSRQKSLYGLVAGFLSAWLFPPVHDMIFFPNVEEKGVLISAFLLFYVVPRTCKIQNIWISVPLTLIVLALASLTKPQVAAILLGLSLYAALSPKDFGSPARARFVMFGSLAAVGYLILRTFAGGYSSAVRSGSLTENIANRYVILMILLTALTILAFAFFCTRESWRVLAPCILMCLSFSLLVVGFGTRSFWMAPFGVMFGSTVAVVVGNLKSLKLQQLATAGLIIVTVGWTLYRIPQVFEPLHGIGAFTQGQIAKDLADEGAVIYTSCAEGSGHFNYYTERRWGVTPEFKPLEGDGAGYRFGIPDDGQYVFGDRRLCAAPGEIAEWDVIWASPGDDGFRLYKRPA